MTDNNTLALLSLMMNELGQIFCRFKNTLDARSGAKVLVKITKMA